MAANANSYYAENNPAVYTSRNPISDEWVRCPVCGQKTRTKLNTETVLIKFPLYCRKCKNTTLINAQDGRISIIE